MRPKVSFANVMSVIAVFIALGGAAYAGTKINGKTIKNNSIPAKKLKKSVLKDLDKCPSNAPDKTEGSATARCSARPTGTRQPALRRPRGCGCRHRRGLLVANKTSAPNIWTDEVTDLGAPSERHSSRPDGEPDIHRERRRLRTRYRCDPERDELGREIQA